MHAKQRASLAAPESLIKQYLLAAGSESSHPWQVEREKQPCRSQVQLSPLSIQRTRAPKCSASQKPKLGSHLNTATLASSACRDTHVGRTPELTPSTGQSAA